jgi:serine/threonine-protein kinase
MVEQNLQNRYRLDEQLAAGGMGTVFAGTDLRLNRRVAVKVLKEQFAGDPRFVERFRREARSVAALSHPNIASIYDYGEEDGRQFIVMELIEGADLARVLRSDAPLSPERATRVATEMCAALSHAHAAGVVHRDIKPANVIIGTDGRVKVTDFGIARAVGDSTLTATGSMLGTAHYLSPEQAVGSPVTATSDIYSAGIVLYEMLTGSVPFTGDSAVAVAMQHVSEEVPAPSSVNKNVSPTLDAVVQRATAHDPGARFAGADAMIDALRGGMGAAARTEALPVKQPSTEKMDQTVWPIPGERWDPRKVGRVVVITFAMLGLVAGAALGWRLLSNENRRPKSEAQEEGGGGGAREEQPPATTSEPTPTETPSSFVVPEGLIGQEFKDAEKTLKDAGFKVEKVDVDSEEPKDTIVGVDPPPGSEVASGDTITLFVSKGEEDGPPETPPGQEKKDEDKDEENGD